MQHYLYISPGDGIMIASGQWSGSFSSLDMAKSIHSEAFDLNKDARILSIDSNESPQSDIVYNYFQWEEYDPEFGYWYNSGDRLWGEEKI